MRHPKPPEIDGSLPASEGDRFAAENRLDSLRSGARINPRPDRHPTSLRPALVVGEFRLVSVRVVPAWECLFVAESVAKRAFETQGLRPLDPLPVPLSGPSAEKGPRETCRNLGVFANHGQSVCVWFSVALALVNRQRLNHPVSVPQHGGVAGGRGGGNWRATEARVIKAVADGRFDRETSRNEHYAGEGSLGSVTGQSRAATQSAKLTGS